VLNGLAWKAASQVFLQGSRLIVAIVLARLLSPHDWGIAAMVLVVSSLVLVFADAALGSALVQRRTLTEKDRSTVFWTSLGIGSAFTAVGIAVAGPIAAFYGEPQVRALVIAMSLSFVVTAVATTQEALLVREMDFRRLELRMMAGTATGAAVGIALALLGFGAWAIIGQQLAIAVASSVLLWAVSPWRPRLVFSLASLRSLGGFGANVFGQRLLYYLHRHAAHILIGRFIGAGALGAYTLAYNVMLVPFSRIAGPVQEVLMPAFARLQSDPDRVAEAWVRATRLIAAVSVPALLGLVVVAPDFVSVVLGERWRTIVPLLQILAWVGLLQSLQTLNSNILMALDRTSTLFRYSIAFFCIHLAAFVLALPYGIVGVAAAYAISSTVIEPAYTWVTARALGVSPLVLVRGLAGVFQAGLLMLAALFAARLMLLETDLGPGGRLLVLIVGGAAVFALASAWRAPELLAEVRRLRRSRTS